MAGLAAIQLAKKKGTTFFSYNIGVVVLFASESLVCHIPNVGTTAKYYCLMDILHVHVIFVVLGAIVSGFDVRSAAKEQVESVGARFLEVTHV